MICSPLQGRLLTLLSRITLAKNVLELGSFTGYSSLCLAEGLQSLDSRVVTCEIDESAANISEKYFGKSEYSNKVMDNK